MRINYNKLLKNIDSIIAFENEGLVKSLLNNKEGTIGHMIQVRTFRNLRALLKRSVDNESFRNKIQTILIENHDEYGEFNYERATNKIMEL